MKPHISVSLSTILLFPGLGRKENVHCTMISLTWPITPAAITFAHDICAGAGITDLPSAATCARDPASSTAASNTETTSSDSQATTTSTEPTETATTTTESDETSTEASTTPTETSTETESESSTQTESPTPTDDAVDPGETDGAMLLRSKDVGVLAAIVAGVAFMM